MKRILCFVLSILFFSCDDGDLQIEAVNFDDAAVDFCVSGSDAKLVNTFFFKIQDDEALLLNMGTGQFKNTTSLDGSISSTLSSSGSPSLVYRFFTGTVAKGYFCDEVPALEPNVVKENTATGGTVTVTTSVIKVDKTNKTYSHNIEIKELSLTNDQGERLTDNSTIDFGSFTTDTPNSASLDVPFSNYTALTTAACDTPPTTGSTRLYKIVNDEFVSLDLPNTLIANMATGGTPRTMPFGTEVVLSNTVLNLLASKELLCAASIDAEMRQGSFVSSEGQISVATVENAPDAEGKITYTHTIVLTGVIMVLKDETDPANDIALDVIPSIEFGTYTTTAP